MAKYEHIKLLVIDDEISIRKLLEFYFKKFFTVTTKSDGLEAMDYIKEGNIPDAIIADLKMPKMDGYEFTGEIRNMDSMKMTPIIILSGNESSSDRIHCLKIGADDYLIKPFNPDELYYRLLNILKRTGKIV
jgi:DNA-binding response OmpR family regulator